MSTYNESENKKVMAHIPPFNSEKVTLKNWMLRPYSTWSFIHPGATVHTVSIPRANQIDKLDVEINENIKDLRLETEEENVPFDTIIENLHVDGITMYKNGKICYEDYLNPFFDENKTHMWFSMTKSLTSLLIGKLVDEKFIDLDCSPSEYISELKGSGYELTTIQQVLDMTTGMEIESDEILNKIKATDSPLSVFLKVGLNDTVTKYLPTLGVVPFIKSTKSTYDALRELKRNKKVKPGEKFEYLTPNADVLGWLIAKIYEKPFQEVIYDEIWSKIGAEHDVTIWTDCAGQGISSAGMTSSLRDLIRIGKLVLNKGKSPFGEQIVSEDWIKQILNVTPEEKQRFQTSDFHIQGLEVAYKNQWWILNELKGEFIAKGLYGQGLYINEDKNFVAAFFSSHTEGDNVNREYRNMISLLRKVANKDEI